MTSDELTGLPVTDSVAPPIVRQPSAPPKCPACEALKWTEGEIVGQSWIWAHHAHESDLRALVAAQSLFIVDLNEHLKTHACEYVLHPIDTKRVDAINELRRKVGIDPPRKGGP